MLVKGAIMTTLIRFFTVMLQAMVLLATTMVFFLLSFLPGKTTSSIFPSLYKFWSKRFFNIFCIVEHIHQKNKLNIPSQFILISNHPSGIELLWLPSRFKVVPLAKEEIRHWVFLGRITASIGTVYVKRKDPGSRHAASHALLEKVREGRSLMIFPEGGCYGKEVQPFFMGAFDLSFKTGVPILPVFLQYEETDTYFWGDYGLIRFMVRALILPRNRNAHLYIFDPIYPGEFKDEKDMHDKVYGFYKAAEGKFGK